MKWVFHLPQSPCEVRGLVMKQDTVLRLISAWWCDAQLLALLWNTGHCVQCMTAFLRAYYRFCLFLQFAYSRVFVSCM